MPLYEYECGDCGAVFELLVASAPVNPRCSQCTSENTRKIVSCPGPLKKGAFPFKPGPVHPLANRMAGNPCGSCHRNG